MDDDSKREVPHTRKKTNQNVTYQTGNSQKLARHEEERIRLQVVIIDVALQDLLIELQSREDKVL